jgi:hypothetical protein
MLRATKSDGAHNQVKTQPRSNAFVALAAVLLAGALSQTALAGALLNESGQAILADAFGVATGPEALTVDWSVLENSSGIYTYTYTILNPAGDLILNDAGVPTSTPEIVDAFSIGFNTTLPGAYVPGSQTGGSAEQNNGIDGLFWSFAAVNPGAGSPALSFQSYLAPGLGNANAQDGNPPSPWSTIPAGQQLPVPEPVPDSSSTLVLLTGCLLMLLLLRSRSLSARFGWKTAADTDAPGSGMFSNPAVR